MLVLGIESSCDETAAAIVSDDKVILSNVIYSQINEHKSYNGVVPEVAARAHLEKIDHVVNKALYDANVTLDDIDAIAGTCGPGLIGGVIVGATFAKTIAFAKEKSFIAINHIEAHAISVRLEHNVEFPYLLMLASGGHCQLCIVHAINNFEILGKTIDDSAGEAFDKVAKMLNLQYPGGPEVEKHAKNGNPNSYTLPRPMCTRTNSDFSFSGLKTAVKLIAQECLSHQSICDLCASFQLAVIDVFKFKIKEAIKYCLKNNININALVIAGGVAANQFIRTELTILANLYKINFYAPSLLLCTDNAAMIAWLGVEKLQLLQTSSLDFAPRPRWPLSRLQNCS